MNRLLDSFWRALAYCLHPKVIGLSLLPLALSAALAVGLGWFFWEPAVAAVRHGIESWSWIEGLLSWLDAMGATRVHEALAPLVVVALAAPLIVIVSLLFVATLMTPAIVNLVAARRFPALERRHGGGFWASLGWSLGCTAVALVALALSLPLWFVPPLILILPPLIWGWLTERVMSFDSLAEHADREERKLLMRRDRWALLAMGVAAGYLGAAPSLIWALGALSLVFAPVLIVVAIWLYTLVFAFSALWFAHYLLAALEALRRERPMVPPADVEAEERAERRAAPKPAVGRMRSTPSGDRPMYSSDEGLSCVSA